MRSLQRNRPFWYAVFPLGNTKRLERERDLYLRLLELAHAEAIEPLLQDALRLAVEISGAERAYLRLNQEGDDEPHPASLAHECSTDDLTTMESNISQGIIAEAIAKGRTIQTPSALLDARFKDRQSVRMNEIEAVLCAPIGVPVPIGVLYLQGRPGGGPFGEDVLKLLEAFAKHVGFLTHNLLQKQAQEDASDPTTPWRDKLKCDELFGRSQGMADLLKSLAGVAPLDGVNILLTGESGTGKTAVARTIVANSPRATRPLIELNCAALPEHLLEAELFGAKQGAHSTATSDLPGKLQAADGGTLFLDEVAELTLPAQAKLLQFLQSKEYYPLGGTEIQRADIRVIAATNAELEAAVAAGTFRQDLLYRLQVMPIRVPTLCERSDDISGLLRHFIFRAAAQNALPRLEPSAAAVQAAVYSPWPGNIRQLEHACQAALVRAVGDGMNIIEAKHLFPDKPQESPLTFQEGTREYQARFLKETLGRHRWNVSKAAQELALTRSHTYNLIRAFSLTRPV